METEWQRNVAIARQTLTNFAKYVKYPNGNLLLKRDKETGQMSLFNNLTRQWVETDETQLQQFASAQAAVRKYE